MNKENSCKVPKKEELIDMVKRTGFDSIEEYEFSKWLDEAAELKLVRAYLHHPPALKLSERFSIMVEKKLKTTTKIVEKFLLHPHEYTADFRIVVDNDKLDALALPPYTLVRSGLGLAGEFIHEEDIVTRAMLAHGTATVYYIDVKGGFSPYHDGKSFSINQKWVYDKYKIFINKIVPEEWFVKTWLPEFAKTTWKTGKIRDKYRGNPDKAAIKEKLDGTKSRLI